MNIPQNVIMIIERLNKNGFEAYLIGGCVRDMLMGKEPADWDIATSAKPFQVKSVFPHTFDTGIKHGTVTAVIDGGHYEITTYRIDGEYKDRRHPENVFFTTDLSLDAARRDFTINAIAWHPGEGYRDYYGGIKHIEQKIICGVGDPAARFREDALRMLRAVRFSCQLGFCIEEDTFNALKNNEGLVSEISKERVRDELVKALSSLYAENLSYFDKCNIMNCIAPYPLTAFKGCNRLIKMLKAFDDKKNITGIMSLFLYDDDLNIAEKTLLYLKFDNKLIKNVKLIKPYLKAGIKSLKYDIKKIISVMDERLFYTVLDVRRAAGINDSGVKELAWEIFLKNEPVYIRDLAVNGTDLMDNLNITGKQIGNVLSKLQDDVINNPCLNSKDTLLLLAKTYILP